MNFWNYFKWFEKYVSYKNRTKILLRSFYIQSYNQLWFIRATMIIQYRFLGLRSISVHLKLILWANVVKNGAKQISLSKKLKPSLISKREVGVLFHLRNVIVPIIRTFDILNDLFLDRLDCFLQFMHFFKRFSIIDFAGFMMYFAVSNNFHSYFKAKRTITVDTMQWKSILISAVIFSASEFILCTSEWQCFFFILMLFLWSFHCFRRFYKNFRHT